MTEDLGHNGTVEQMSPDELQTYLAARYQDYVGSGRFTEDQAVAKVNVESSDFDSEGAWICYCSCYWRGNNPYPNRAGALSSLTKHYEQVGVSSGG